MPGFELEQVDGGQPIDLPYGETVIGRGPFLGTHLNPCFIQTSLGAPSEPLEKDQWHCLKEGSIFSLLPGKYIFRVRVITEDSTLSNSQSFEEETQTETEEKSNPSCVSQETLEYNPQAKSSTSHTTESTRTAQEEEKDEDTHKPDPTSCSQDADVTSPAKAVESAPLTPQRKRVLPAWMTAATPAAQSPSTVKAATKRAPAQASASKAPAAQSKRATGPKRARTKKISSGDEEDEEDDEEPSDVEQKPRKRLKKLNSDTEESQDQAPAPKPSQERSLEDRLSEDSEEERKGRGRKRAEAAPRSRAGGSTAEAGDSGNSEVKKLPSQNGKQSAKTSSSEISSSSSKPRVQRRTPCPYGASCYRKNPVHFQECSHPGDDDFEEEQSNGNEDDDDDRPECPYGTDCYRKNPLHKKEYKHTQPPAKKSAPDDEDDDDEDRYENSFINDESEEEEVDEDSDYVPESDDSGKEDIKRLQKEAKAFLKRKK
ncbi:aprataxin and PNK-like factor isoform X2 [Colossoma macropomum]|uniref:aprataxin and PNK-like factor isoform X2 n=1 Tax=Colossoma macropomum TaxID=42526 RepID=UPI001864E590|nr:aprataxin and PNK-like factor isoform X2 [Colossoma macropomum]